MFGKTGSSNEVLALTEGGVVEASQGKVQVTGSPETIDPSIYLVGGGKSIETEGFGIQCARASRDIVRHTHRHSSPFIAAPYLL